MLFLLLLYGRLPLGLQDSVLGRYFLVSVHTEGCFLDIWFFKYKSSELCTNKYECLLKYKRLLF